MKIYTKTGDSGETGLFGGQRVSKDELRIEAYGTLDELNSHIGLLTSFDFKAVDKEFFHNIQSILFDMGSHLASVPGKELKLPELKEKSISDLEETIDHLSDQLPALKSFILPGGSREAAQIHIARTVCRRAERRIVSLNKSEGVNPLIISFINRLSDLLFVLARAVIYEQGKKEIPWKPQK